LVVAIPIGVRWNLYMVLICIYSTARDDEHQFIMCYFFFFLPFGLLCLKKFCSVRLPISSLSHWFFGNLVFWAPCIFWLLIPCHLISWQRYLSHSVAAFSIWWLFPLLCRSFFLSCRTICQSFPLIVEPLGFYSGSHCLCLCVPVSFLLFLQ
jgi:hypothetical protein